MLRKNIDIYNITIGPFFQKINTIDINDSHILYAKPIKIGCCEADRKIKIELTMTNNEKFIIDQSDYNMIVIDNVTHMTKR